MEEVNVIRILYKSILHREPEQEGLIYWSEVFESGSLKLSEIIKEFETSPEAQKLNKQPKLFVKTDLESSPLVELSIPSSPSVESRKYFSGAFIKDTLWRGTLYPYVTYKISDFVPNDTYEFMIVGDAVELDENISEKLYGRIILPPTTFLRSYLPVVVEPLTRWNGTKSWNEGISTVMEYDQKRGAYMEGPNWRGWQPPYHFGPGLIWEAV